MAKHRHYHRKHHYRHHKNPLGIDKGSLTTAAGVAAGMVGAAAIPAVVMPAQNSGPIGYLLNAASAIALKLAADAVVDKNTGDNVLAGGLGFTLVRIIKDNFSVPGLSAYWPSFLPNFPAASNPYGQMAQPAAYAPPAVAAAGGKGMAGSRFRGRFSR